MCWFQSCLFQGCPNPTGISKNKETLLTPTFQCSVQKPAKQSKLVKIYLKKKKKHSRGQCQCRDSGDTPSRAVNSLRSGLMLPYFILQDVSCVWPTVKVTAGHIIYLSHFLMFFHAGLQTLADTGDLHTHHSQECQLDNDTLAFYSSVMFYIWGEWQHCL